MKDKIWVRGQIVSQEDAVVNVMSPTSQFGLNVFEGIRGYWNDEDNCLYIIKLEEHVERLLQSCRLIGIESPYTKDEIIRYIKDTIKASKYYETDIAIRITIFGDGIGSWHSTENFSMFISPIKRERTNLNKLKGKKACITSWGRINDNTLPPRAKVGANYINSRYAYLQAKRDGYDLPIFLGEDGKVSESSGACIFLFRNGVLITPDITSSILESITRNLVIEMAKENGLRVEERKVDRTELYLAKDIFVCGTAAEITPVVSVDKININNGKIGDISFMLLKKYLKIVSGKEIGYKKYLTKV